MSRLLAPLALALGIATCASPSAAPALPSPWVAATGQIEDDELASVSDRLWELRLAQNPIWATHLGDARYYGKLPLDAPAQRAHLREKVRRLLRQVRHIDPGRMQGEDRITLALIHEDLELEVLRDQHPLAPRTWNLHGLGGPQTDLLSLAADQPQANDLERAQAIERWRRMPSAITRKGEDLREGLAQGKAAPRHAVLTVIAQLDALLATPVHESPLVTLAMGDGRWHHLENRVFDEERLQKQGYDTAMLDELRRTAIEEPNGTLWIYLPSPLDELTLRQRASFVGDCADIASKRIYPAFQRYRTLLQEEVLPAARADDEPGLSALEGGLDYYTLEIRRHTSLQLTPAEIHQIGLDELERIHGEMREIGGRVFGTTDLAEIQRRLREDEALHFTTAEEVEATAIECVERAEAAATQVFGHLPAARCEVVPIPAHEAPDTTIAYYHGPSPDGSRPGRYYINTFAPTTRPRYEAEVLAYHEAVPGHHTQIAIAQKLDALPLVRREGGINSGVTAYVEGWALYTERLCDELGLYSADTDRLGMLSFDSWRASRLVVDTGLHAFGWSRQNAVGFLFENTLLARNNCENEVDRYIAWPGQALAYKLGQREILALRAEASEQLGEEFDLSRFHDVVLGSGAVSLAALRMLVEEWVASGGGNPGATVR